MSKLSPQELEKIRKAALHSVTLSYEMKTSVADSKLKELTSEIKKQLLMKDLPITIIVIKG
jgi:hypothetical protein